MSDGKHDRGREADQAGSTAPLIVFGTIGLIAVTCVSVVVVGHCQRDAPYQDAELVRPGTPPPPSLPPPPDRPRPDPATLPTPASTTP